MAHAHAALIVGGGTGIGYASARRLLRRGVAVALTGRREEVLAGARRQLCEELPDATVVSVAGDAADEGDAERIVRASVDVLGRLDLAINCAGSYEPTPLLEMDGAAWRRTLSSNLDAALYPTVAAAREMARSGGGRIVLISSINAPLSEPESAHYSAAKAAVSSLARSMAVDLAKHNVRVNAIAPGWVHTAMVDDFVRNATPDALARLNILGRVGQADEIANVIEYVALDAPEYLDGATIFVDGGQTAMAPLI
jgi:NAD(P)-dependent dehydrogenase (short-subunit alcohol dehydrogenase family)